MGAALKNHFVFGRCFRKYFVITYGTVVLKSFTSFDLTGRKWASSSNKGPEGAGRFFHITRKEKLIRFGV